METAADGNTLTGQTYRIKDGDTSIVERLTIEKREDGFYYVAEVPQNKQPVAYKITQVDKNGFSCENKAHDFPTNIKYKMTEKRKSRSRYIRRWPRYKIHTGIPAIN
ncbi:MAG: hypothetical protein WDO16_15420 [Bacteroidota bacterium]